MMNNGDLFASLFYITMTAILVGQFVLNFWAWRIQRRLERETDGPVPVALKDREEVTFWQTISSAILASLGIRILLAVPVDGHLLLGLFGFALAIKTIPSARWLIRYYRNGFSEE